MVCASNFRGYKPSEYFNKCDLHRVFRWTFIFVSGNGLVHEWDPEGYGMPIGVWEGVDVEWVGRWAGGWLDEEPEVWDEEEKKFVTIR